MVRSTLLRRLAASAAQATLLASTLVTTTAIAVVRAPVIQARAIAPAAVSEFQPNIKWGGRSVAVDVAPGQNQVGLVATESGGLFKTANAGGSWSHVDGLLPFRMSDVKYAPSNGSVVIATTWQNSDTLNKGGIYRSTDGGSSWTKATLAGNTPICGAGNFFGNGIAFEPGANNVYVGNACGLAVSPDLGANWTLTTLPSGKQVQAVVAQSGGIINLCANDGLYRYTNTGGVLTRTNGPVTLPGGSATCFQGNGYVPGTHNLGAAPQESNVLFTVGTGTSTTLCGGTSTNPAGILILFESDDSGATWTSLGSNTFRCGSRQAFIGTHVSRDGVAADFDVYWSAGLDVSRATCSSGVVGNRCTTLPSSPNVTIAHSDFGSIAFDPTSNCAQYLVSDGGVQQTSDCGGTFTMAGTSGPNGFGGLQIYQVAGQVIRPPSVGSTNLIFGTQDNDIWGSSDNGATWPNSNCCEGFNLQLQHSVASHSGQLLTGVSCGACGDFKANADMSGVGGWPDPPSSLGSNPGSDIGGPVFVDQKVYTQWTLDSSTPPNQNLDITTDTGGSWNAVTNATISTVGAGAGPLMSYPRMSGTPAVPILYQAFCTTGCGFIAPSGGLKQISGARTGTATVSAADTGLGRVGTYNDGYGAFLTQEPAFGVDPNNSAHLIAADVNGNQMRVSTTSGTSWTADANLTNRVTDFGRYPFNIDNLIGSQAHAVAFNPANGNMILVGTEAAGIIASIDGGATWQRMLGSKSVSAVTSFFFDEVNNDIIVSSYGRGLWKLDMTRRAATLDYTGDTHDDFNDSATLSAHLYDSANGPSSPIDHVTVNFTLGSQSCSGQTDNNGNVSCVIPTLTQNAGSYTVTASYAGDAQWLPQTKTVPFTIDREDTALTYTGVTTQDYHDPATMSAHLFDPTGGAPIAGKTLTFTLGVGDTCTTSSPTDGSGNASCTIVPTQQAGNYPVVVNFAGDSNYLSATTTFTPFVITEEETTTTYTGDTLIANARNAHLAGVLKEDGIVPIMGRQLVFTLGTGITAQTCTGTTDATGTAGCDILVNQPLGPGTVRVDFDPLDVDEFYLPSSDTRTTLIFGFLDRGAMVIGDLEVGLGNTVQFWGAKWSAANPMSGGDGPNAFKGFASDTSTNPPVCGVNYTARPGNSGHPQATLPAYMGIYVSTAVNKHGSTITGDVFEIVVVKTDPGYQGNPGHPGTGTLVASPSMPTQPAIFCHA